MSFWRGLGTNVAQTRPDHRDAKLRGRTFAVPFAAVWEAVRETARATPRWSVTEEDAARGVLRAEARTLLWRFTDDVEVRVTLDGDGMTRVDLRSSSRVGKGDLGANARRIVRFLHRLDRHFRHRGGRG